MVVSMIGMKICFKIYLKDELHPCTSVLGHFGPRSLRSF